MHRRKNPSTQSLRAPSIPAFLAHRRERGRNRRLIVEQFEDRRLLALAVNDSYSIGVNETLEVHHDFREDAPWRNDSYHWTWPAQHWDCLNFDPWPECVEYGWVDILAFADGDILSGATYGSEQSLDGTGVRSFAYSPDPDFVGIDSFIYRIWDDDDLADGEIPTATITITVVENRDIAIDSFTTDGTDLEVEYTVTGFGVHPFSITLYASSDGETPDYALQSLPGDTSPGPHTLPIPASFDDLPEDYYLVAVVDGLYEFNEINEDNNDLPFAGGSFIVTEPGTGDVIRHVPLDDTADSITVSADGDSLIISTRDPSLSSTPQGTPQGVYYDVTGDAKYDGSSVIYNGTIDQLDVDVLLYDVRNVETRRTCE